MSNLISNVLTVLNTLKIPTGNYGILRSNMPQIDSKDMGKLHEYLDGLGVEYTHTKIPTKKLKLTQSEINKTKILKIMMKLRRSKKTDPVIVCQETSGYYYVLDGSHRFIAMLNIDDKWAQKMDCMIIQLPVSESLEILNAFPFTTHRSISCSSLCVS